MPVCIPRLAVAPTVKEGDCTPEFRLVAAVRSTALDGGGVEGGNSPPAGRCLLCAGLLQVQVLSPSDKTGPKPPKPRNNLALTAVAEAA